MSETTSSATASGGERHEIPVEIPGRTAEAPDRPNTAGPFAADASDMRAVVAPPFDIRPGERYTDGEGRTWELTDHGQWKEATLSRVWAIKVWWDGETLQVKPVYEDEAMKDVTDD